MCLEVVEPSKQMWDFQNSRCVVGLAFAVAVQEVHLWVVEVVARSCRLEVLVQGRQRRRHCYDHRWDSRRHSCSILVGYPN
jgi:hypothetical protein